MEEWFLKVQSSRSENYKKIGKKSLRKIPTKVTHTGSKLEAHVLGPKLEILMGPFFWDTLYIFAAATELETVA